MIRALKAATGDVVVVATVPTIEPYGDIREYAIKLFENHGSGIGEKGKDNGLLILLALKERQVWIEVGYASSSGSPTASPARRAATTWCPQFRAGNYGAGLRAGTERIIGRIAQGRGVTLDGVRRSPRERAASPAARRFRSGSSFLVFIIIMIISRIGGGPGVGRRDAGAGAVERLVERRRAVRRRLRRRRRFGGGGFGGGFGGFGGGEQRRRRRRRQLVDVGMTMSSCDVMNDDRMLMTRRTLHPAAGARARARAAVRLFVQQVRRARKKRSRRSGRRSRTSCSAATT